MSGPQFLMDAPASVPATEEQVCALLVDLGAVAWERTLAPVKDAHQRKQQRVGTQIGNAPALGHERVGVNGLTAFVLSEPLAGIIGDVLVPEPAEAVTGELAIVEPGLVVADNSGCH